MNEQVVTHVFVEEIRWRCLSCDNEVRCATAMTFRSCVKCAEQPIPKVVERKERPRGLGDTIAGITKFFGILPCGGCKKRQAKLNELFPYKE